MTFEKIDIKNNEVNNERSCIILCNIQGKELQIIKNYGAVFGIKDQIIVNFKNGETLVKNLIENKDIKEDEDGLKYKAIIFNNISPAKINIFLESLRKSRINNVLKATVTETSKEWTLNFLLENLIEEKRALSAGKSVKH